MRVSAMGDLLERVVCSKWINRKFPERCAAFDKDKWEALRNKLPTQDMHFCIDRFEYPNQKGEYPVIYVDWYEAEEALRRRGQAPLRRRRVDVRVRGRGGDCRTPTATTATRTRASSTSPGGAFDRAAYGTRDGTTLIAELDRLWQGVPSGLAAAVQEPVRRLRHDRQRRRVDALALVEGRAPRILKGGYWGPVRTRCRPATRAHGREHAFYQQGFRCCGDRSAAAPSAGK